MPFIKLKPKGPPVPAFATFQLMHLQTKRDGLPLLLHHAANDLLHTITTTEVQQNTCKVTAESKEQTTYCWLKVTKVMQILRKHRLNDARVSAALNLVQR